MIEDGLILVPLFSEIKEKKKALLRISYHEIIMIDYEHFSTNKTYLLILSATEKV